MKNTQHTQQANAAPSVALSLLPMILLIASLVCIIVYKGADAVAEYGPLTLLGCAGLAVLLTWLSGTFHKDEYVTGLKRSFSDVLPTLGILLCIAMISATWMLSGIVPTMITYGLSVMNPNIFLFVTCAVCSCVSVLLGSSWTTIATIGVAFLGIGQVLGYSDGWIAGAIISGAYFGDKVSPLSDTTAVASSTCKVELFTHIRYLMITAIPTMAIALLVFLIVGFFVDSHAVSHSADISRELEEYFNISPWLLIVPIITGTMCAFRVKALIVLSISALMGLVCIFIAQPHIMPIVNENAFMASLHVLCAPTQLPTPDPMLGELISTGGIYGMLPTIFLVVCAMVFGGTLIGTGMLRSLTGALTNVLKGRSSIVTATVGTGLVLNSCTADQYISLIIGGNLYGNLYKEAGLEPRLLSRSIEDSISVTSPLIPWNSCGLTQSTVLGISTVVYLPYCIFNYLQPLMSIFMARIGYKISQTPTHVARAHALSHHGNH